MPTIFLGNIVEGHVTEADYYTLKGQLLIGQGEIITAQHLSLDTSLQIVWSLPFEAIDCNILYGL